MCPRKKCKLYQLEPKLWTTWWRLLFPVILWFFFAPTRRDDSSDKTQMVHSRSALAPQKKRSDISVAHGRMGFKALSMLHTFRDFRLEKRSWFHWGPELGLYCRPEWVPLPTGEQKRQKQHIPFTLVSFHIWQEGCDFSEFNFDTRNNFKNLPTSKLKK